LPGSKVQWRFQVAQSRQAIDGQIKELRSTLVSSFAALGLGLLVLAALQAIYGLWPLRRQARSPQFVVEPVSPKDPRSRAAGGRN
jgi:hypothetical protein